MKSKTIREVKSFWRDNVIQLTQGIPSRDRNDNTATDMTWDLGKADGKHSRPKSCQVPKLMKMASHNIT